MNRTRRFIPWMFCVALLATPTAMPLAQDKEPAKPAATDPKNDDFFANWGTGLALIRNSKEAVTNATIVNNVVRVNDKAKYEATLLVARHFYPFKQSRCAGQDGKRGVLDRYVLDCVGAMVGVGMGSTSSGSSRIFNMIGIGLTIGGQFANPPQGASQSAAWNFGIGVGRKFGVQTLGDGFAENEAPPAGETQVRYKTRDITSQFIYFTAHW